MDALEIYRLSTLIFQVQLVNAVPTLAIYQAALSATKMLTQLLAQDAKMHTNL